MITPSEAFWNLFKKTNGALSCAEGLALINISDKAPQGMYIELGSHKGKSSMCVAYSLFKEVIYGELIHDPTYLYLVEPEFKDVEWENKTIALVDSVIAPKLKEWIKIIGIADYSTNVLERYNKYSFVFIDSGSHSDELVMNECLMLEDRVIPNGIIAFHDKGSQFTKVDEAYDYLLSTGKYEKIEIDWQPIFDYVAEHNLEEGNNSWHQYPELPHPPNFIGAVKRK